MLELRYYLARDGRSPFEGWFASLDPVARAKVTVAIARLETGQPLERGRDGEVLVILLTGGTKKRQQRDIDAAIAMWTDYRQRRRGPR